MGRDTAGLAEFVASKPANEGLRDMDARMVVQAGGLPVKFGKALVGGIGVGGAPWQRVLGATPAAAPILLICQTADGSTLPRDVR